MRNPKSEMEDSVENPKAFAEIVTNNKEMLSIFHYTESIARTSESVLITGKTGVGKELIAKTIHNLSARKGRFVVFMLQVSMITCFQMFFSATRRTLSPVLIKPA